MSIEVGTYSHILRLYNKDITMYFDRCTSTVFLYAPDDVCRYLTHKKKKKTTAELGQ